MSHGLSSAGRPSVEETLKDLASRAAENAYAPYSNFRVGAALLCRSGKCYSSCNIENASYGLAVCAERNVIAAAVAAEGGDADITDVVVVTLDGDDCSPCGACRQVLVELAPSAVIRFLQNGRLMAKNVDDLLPERFDQSSLKGRNLSDR